MRGHTGALFPPIFFLCEMRNGGPHQAETLDIDRETNIKILVYMLTGEELSLADTDESPSAGKACS